jgi:hypothetical protein
MATAAHRAGDRGASGDRRCLPEGGRIGLRPPGAWGRRPPAKPANEVTTGSEAAKPAITVNRNPNSNPKTENPSAKKKAKAETPKPANENEVTTGFGVEWSSSDCARRVLRRQYE